MGRLVGIFPKEKLLNLHEDFVIANIVQIRNAISNVTNFILRTVVGETPNDKLYENFLEGLKQVQEGGGGAAAHFQTIETIWLINILISLGYWEENLHNKFDEDNFKYIAENKKEIVEQINKSIESSHM